MYIWYIYQVYNTVPYRTESHEQFNINVVKYCIICNIITNLFISENCYTIPRYIFYGGTWEECKKSIFLKQTVPYLHSISGFKLIINLKSKKISLWRYGTLNLTYLRILISFLFDQFETMGHLFLRLRMYILDLYILLQTGERIRDGSVNQIRMHI